MPTHEEDSAFMRDFRGLTAEQRQQFLRARDKMVEDLRRIEGGERTGYRSGLVKKLHARRDLYELRWAPDGRATFSIGSSRRPGVIHIRWHRCGTHDMLP
ncbi:MAG: hypothetical protein OXC06_05830 [Acidimicrobiaceae bacterium]|nr:hypothetical protein [Acidimicrobiaceae bacterium]